MKRLIIIYAYSFVISSRILGAKIQIIFELFYPKRTTIAFYQQNSDSLTQKADKMSSKIYKYRQVIYLYI